VLLASLEQLAEEEQISPLSPPDLDPAKIVMPADGPFVYEFDIEVRPEFDLPQYRGLKLRRYVHTFTPEEVAEEERRVLAPYGQIVPKPDGQAEIGDVLIADVTIAHGGQVISSSKETQIRVEKQLAFRDGIARKFAEQIVGVRAGESRVVDIELSGQVAEPRLRGQTVQATFAVQDVKTIRMPELTHEFLHTFGVHDVEQFRELLGVVLERRLAHEQRQFVRSQVLQQISSASQLELPRDLLARQARRTLLRKAMEMRADGIPESEIESRLRVVQQDLIAVTAMTLKEQFVLQKIAEVEKIDVDDDDLNAEIERIADQTNESPRRVRARLEREEALDALAAEILERKALEIILESAEYEDVPLTEADRAPSVATVETQAIPGQMHDPTVLPPEEGSSAAPSA
jgi:trigger factor